MAAVQEQLVVPQRILLQLEAVLVVQVYIILYLVRMLLMLAVAVVPAMVAKVSHRVQVALAEEVPEVQMLEEQLALQTPAAAAAVVDIFLQAGVVVVALV